MTSSLKRQYSDVIRAYSMASSLCPNQDYYQVKAVLEQVRPYYQYEVAQKLQPSQGGTGLAKVYYQTLARVMATRTVYQILVKTSPEQGRKAICTLQAAMLVEFESARAEQACLGCA